MNKRLLFPQNNGRERDIFFVRDDRSYLQKHASNYHPRIQEYISKAKPINGLIQILATALGAYPFWPQNVNGDRFSIPALAHEGDDYGYRTFLSNANYFVHHINSDPALAKGKVLAAVWNEKANRVELILGIDPEKDPDAARDIDDGKFLSFSMGARLPFDVCSVCGNRAKTRLMYCDHLKYMMNQIDPITGLLVGALNPFPKFFDISRVLIPADKTAYMWEKIAAAASPISKIGSAELADLPVKMWFDDKLLSEKVAERQELYKESTAGRKTAAVSKKADIVKEVPVTSVKPLFTERLKKYLPVAKHALDATSPDLDLDKLKGFSLAQIISTLLGLGIVPKPSESKSIHDLFAPSANSVSRDLGPKSFSPALANRLLPIIPERSFARPFLVRRIVLLAARPEEELRKVAGREQKEMFHAGLAAGLIAAALAYSGKQGNAFTRLIAEHPFLSSILGGTLIRGMREFSSDKPVITGEVSVAPHTNTMYNTDWQRRFVNLQERPVTVIKTGADHNLNDVFGGLSLLLALEGVQQPALKFLDHNPHILTDSAMSKESSAWGQEVSEVLVSARRFIKTASLENVEFLEGVPESSRNSVWDLAILNAADKIARKLS